MIDVRDADITTPGGRALFDGVTLSLSRDRVALVGRNGVGKSTLLAALVSGHERVRLSGAAHYVPQLLGGRPSASVVTAEVARECVLSGLSPDQLTGSGPLSHGERRKLALIAAKLARAEILLLDEPTDDLDDRGVGWLRGWLRQWPGCLVVATHDRRLLSDFDGFLIARESGCRGFIGSLRELDEELEREHHASEARYVAGLNRLTTAEAHTLHVARRKDRKKRYGRCKEIDRATPRARLNQKRDHAQVSHGRLAKLREARLTAVRDLTRSMRRALDVRLGTELAVPILPAGGGQSAISLSVVSMVAGARRLFESFDLEIDRDRVAIVGPNGAGKSTLLDVMLGRRTPMRGTAVRDLRRIGAIAQGATDWMDDETLLSYLSTHGPARSPEAVARLLVAHRFPLALAARPIGSLSPGERVRAALIGLLQRAPAVDVLVLDEPTFSLDLVGQRALTQALAAWPGGLVVASHDRAFLDAVGFDRIIAL